jgi:hypothetical protein
MVEATGLDGDCLRLRRVGMHDADCILAARMDSAVNDESGWIYRPVGVTNDVALKVDFHEIGRSDLIIGEAVGVDEKVMLPPWHSHRDMILGHLAPAEIIEHTVAAGQIDAQLPLLRCDSGVP